MSFSTETSVKAVRKRHHCDGCGRHIEVGQPAMRWVGMTDGDFGACIYHPECRVAEIAYNNDVLNYYCDGNWYPISEIEHESWQWLVEDHPVVAARLNILTPASEPARDDGGG